LYSAVHFLSLLQRWAWRLRLRFRAALCDTAEQPIRNLEVWRHVACCHAFHFHSKAKVDGDPYLVMGLAAMTFAHFKLSTTLLKTLLSERSGHLSPWVAPRKFHSENRVGFAAHYSYLHGNVVTS